MVTIIPVTGSFIEFAQRFIDESLAFGMGWAYWYLRVTVCTTLTRNGSFWYTDALAGSCK